MKLKKNKTRFFFLNGRIIVDMKHYKQQQKKMESTPLGIHTYWNKNQIQKDRELIWNTTNYNQNLNT